MSQIEMLLVAQIVFVSFLAGQTFADYAAASRLELGVVIAAILWRPPWRAARRLQWTAATLAFLWLPLFLVAVAGRHPV